MKTEALIVWVNAGDAVEVDHCTTMNLYPLSADQNQMRYRVYSSADRNIEFRTAPGVVNELDILIDLPVDGTNNRYVETKVFFGDTHIKGQAKNVKTQKETDFQLNFDVS